MRISSKHPNRRLYNWLVYEVGDRCLRDNAGKIVGVVYDLGCGEAPYRDWILQHGDQYIGVDWSGSMHNTRVDVEANLNEPLPVVDEVADTVVSFSVLEHLRNPQLMINEAFRIIKPGGYFLLQVPWQWRIHEEPHDYFRYTTYGLRMLFGNAGFESVIVKPQAGFFTTAVLKLNYFSLRIVRGTWLMRLFLTGCLAVPWYLGQKVAPHLDYLDGNWSLEATGYFVTARKPLEST